MSKYVIDCDHNKLKLLSDDFCIEYLQQSGWMQNHDKKIFEQGKECGVNDIASNIAHARQAGYEDGYNDGYNAAKTGEYQRGLEDAWEAAKELSIMTPEEAEKVFPGAGKYNRFNLGYSGAEAVKKLQDYMQKEKDDLKIHIGDEAERKTGKWIYDSEPYPLGNPYGHYGCDQCGESVPARTNFCPNCGAQMIGGDENAL